MIFATMNFMNPDISIWLVPEKSQELTLQKTIDNLAQKYQACSFIPHITVYYLGTNLSLNETIKIVEEETADVQPFSINFDAIKYSDIFIKTLYIQYRIDPPLKNLYEKIKNKMNKYFDYKLSPHLSLIYKNQLVDAEKQKIISQLDYPKVLTIDRLMIITKNGSIITKEADVLDWHIVFEKQL